VPAASSVSADVAEIPHAERCHAAGQLHPRNQNTATGKLTEKMFLSFFERAKDLLGR
jgi:uracil-DNA glycosylase